MTFQRRGHADDQVRRVLVQADDLVQEHLTVNVNVGMADLMERRARRDRYARPLTRRLRQPFMRRWRPLEPLVVIDPPHVVKADGQQASTRPLPLLRGLQRRTTMPVTVATAAITVAVGLVVGFEQRQQDYVTRDKPAVIHLRDTSGRIAEVVFSPHGDVLAIVNSKTGTVQFWNPTSGRPIGQPLRHSGVTAAAFSPDGRTLVTAGLDETTVWNLTTPHPPRGLSTSPA
ncbi:WD40 repeat domain-containing protein [Dactylosporangium cerinum]